MISDEAVEAAARASFNKANHLQWDDLHRFDKEVHLGITRAALEAAAPYMLAQVWEEGYRDCDREWEQTSDIVAPDEDRFVAKNPYGSQA